MAQAAGTVEFIYDFVSIPCYIAWKCLDAMIRPCGGKVLLTPVLCGGIFKAIGNAGPLAIPAKREWYMRDLAMWARRRGVVLVDNPFLPIRTLPLMRGSVLATERNETSAYVEAVFDSIYVRQRNLSDLNVVKQALHEAGLDSDAYLQGMERADIKQSLLRSTEAAVARGVFGVPSFFVNDELFFGQDRLEFVADALRSKQ